VIKTAEVVLIETQEELNTLAEVVDGVEVDALHIDEPYVAFMEEVLYVIPQRKLETGHWAEQVKPRPFRKWYKSMQRRSEKCKI